MNGQEHAEVKRGIVPLFTFRDYDEVEAFAESLIEAHDQIVDKAGYAPDLSIEKQNELFGKMCSAISSVFMGHFGAKPDYEDLFIQVSVFADHVANDHIFHDGNKRTALKGSLAILHLNGVKLDIPDADDPVKNKIYQWIQQVVEKKCTPEQLADFLT